MQNKNTKKNFQDLISGVVIMLIAGFFYWSTLNTKKSFMTGKGATKPETVPQIVAIAMLALGVLIIVKWAIAFFRGKLPAPVVEDDSADCEGMTEAQIKNRHLFQKITMPITLVLIFLFIFFMPKIGFTISAFIFLSLQITLLSTDLSAKSWLKNILIALVAALLIYIIFGCAFALAVPKVSFIDLGLDTLYRSIFG